MPVSKKRLIASLAGASVLVLAVAAFRLLPPTYPTGDRAFLELYALHATGGNLTVGPYSRVGWNHPGPVYLYALAPFYALSGQREFSLDSTALLINLASLAALIAVVSMVGDAYLGWSLIAALAIFLFRPGPVRDVGELLVSPWNPHVVMLPFALLIALCAALAVGRVRVLPAVALVGSFVVQTHIGLLPCTMAMVIMAVALWRHGRRASRSTPVGVATPRDPPIRPWVLASVGVLTLLWMLPLVDQVVGSGNAGEILRFFLSDDRPRPSPSTAFAAVAYGLSAAVRPQENLAMGNVIISAAGLGPLPAIWLVLQVTLLAGVWRWAVRQGRSFHAALCVLCLATTAVAVWSAFNIHGMVRDYLVFWMSVLGMVNLSALGGAVAWWAARALRRRGIAIPVRIGPAAVTVFLFGATGLAQDYRRTLAGEGRFSNRRAAVRTLSRDLEDRMRARGYASARIRIAPAVRVVAAGVVLQLYKTDIPVAVTDPLVPVFTEVLRSTGVEDVVFRFVGPDLNGELRDRSDHMLVGRNRNVSVYEELRRR